MAKRFEVIEDTYPDVTSRGVYNHYWEAVYAASAIAEEKNIMVMVYWYYDDDHDDADVIWDSYSRPYQRLKPVE